MSGDESTLIIPVENQVRELDAKLLLACLAVERGFPVIIGSRTYVHYGVAWMPRGVYLAKSMRTLSDKMFDIIRRLGHEIVAFDEEGLLRAPDAYYYKRRLSAFAMSKVSALLAWGPDNARVFREFSGYTGVPIHVTGNPRIDILRPELRGYFAGRVAELRSRYGEFVLVNSNIGHANHFVPGLRGPGAGADEYATALAAHRTEMFGHLRDAIRTLSAAFPERTILVRPHPVELHEPWEAIASECANVIVSNEGNVIPWLMACSVLVQNGCQTAVEGALAGTPVVSYRPIRSELLDLELILSLSHDAADLDELVETVRAILQGRLGEYDHPERKRQLEKHIAALDGPLAAERMLDALEEAGYASARPPKPPALQFLSGWSRTQIRTAKKRVNMRRRKHRNSLSYHSHRFPELSEDDVRERIEGLGAQLGRFEGLRVKRLRQHVFEISRA